MQWQGKSVRKVSGGRRRPAAMKRRAEIGLAPADTHIGEDRHRIIRTFGGNDKVRGDVALVSDPKTGNAKKVKIETVKDNKANQHYMRRNIITKGAVIKTEIGSARIMSRPGQDGIINALLLE